MRIYIKGVNTGSGGMGSVNEEVTNTGSGCMGSVNEEAIVCIIMLPVCMAKALLWHGNLNKEALVMKLLVKQFVIC